MPAKQLGSSFTVQQSRKHAQKYTTMKIMQFGDRLWAVYGIPDYPQGTLPVWFLFLLLVVFALYGQVCFVLLGQPDIFSLSMVIYVSVAISGVFVQMSMCLWKRHALRQFVQHLRQYIATISIRYGSGDFFRATERSLAFYFKCFICCTTASVSMYLAQPVIGWTWAYATGTADENTFRAPLRDMYYVFDERRSPARELCFLMNVAMLTIVVTAFLLVDLLFMGTCFYVVALYEHLRMRLADANGLQRADRTRSIVDCVRLHLDILRFITEFNELFGGIVFLQFVYSMITLCTCVLTAAFSEASKLALVGLNFIVLTAELFLFCTTGTMVLSAGDRLQEAVYQLNWLAYSPGDRKMLQFIMLRTQLPSGLSAVGYFMCSHNTFSKIMSKVFSALAFLKKVVETTG